MMCCLKKQSGRILWYLGREGWNEETFSASNMPWANPSSQRILFARKYKKKSAFRTMEFISDPCVIDFTVVIYASFGATMMLYQQLWYANSCLPHKCCQATYWQILRPAFNIQYAHIPVEPTHIQNISKSNYKACNLKHHGCFPYKNPFLLLITMLVGAVCLIWTKGGKNTLKG